MITEMIKNVAVNSAKIGAGVLVANTAVFATKKVISNRKESKVAAAEKEAENNASEKEQETEAEIGPGTQETPVETVEKTTKRKSSKKEEKVIPQFSVIRE